jgi:osmotically-inducible protein OsmY
MSRPPVPFFLSQEYTMAVTHRRSDIDIFSAARKALDDHPRVPQDVRVHVDHGTVTLTGNVRWSREQSEAEDAVRRVDGVLRVVNNIIAAHMANPQGFEAPDESP